jgi:excinuclease ABC subunit B
MYADRESEAMLQALGETERRRALQVAYNEAHGITPQTIVKAVRNLETHREEQVQRAAAFQEAAGLPPDELLKLAKSVEREMKRAAHDLEFERAAELRDRLVSLRRHMDGEPVEPAGAGGGSRGHGRPRRRRQGP